jgi:cytoskeletal protein CcmA (bactofilin family)
MAWGVKRDISPPTSDQIENVLGRSSSVTGDLKAEGSFRVDGTITGSVESAGAIIVGESGCVNGDVRGRDVVIAGKVTGNVTATSHLDIVASGRIEGDIDAQSVRIETGGVFRGVSRMGGQPQDDAAAVAHLSAIK